MTTPPPARDVPELARHSQPRFAMEDRHPSRTSGPRPTGSHLRPAKWALWLLALTAGVVLWFELGDSRTLASHEAFAAVPARAMLQTGEWVVPYYGGLPRLKKPPLVYWVIAASSLVFGELSEWTMRVPSTLAALGLAALIGLWAKRWYGPLAGYAAALAQITSVWVLMFGRKAEVDMQLCLLTTGALALVAGASAGESPRRSFVRWFGFYALLSLGWLAKFHYGPAMVLAPTVLYLTLQYGLRGLRPLLNVPGLVLFAAALLVWPLWMLERIPNAWDVWQHEILGRAIGAFGYEPIWFYVPHLLSLPLPWTPLAVVAIVPSWRAAWPGLLTAVRTWLGARGHRRAATRWLIEYLRSGNRREQFLWIWILAQLAIACLSANKHKHYLIALFPAVSILAGVGTARLVAAVRAGRWQLPRRQAWTATAACAIGGIATAVGIGHKWPALVEAGAALGFLIALGGTALVWLVQKHRWTPAVGTAFALFLGCYLLAVGIIVPGQDHRRPIAEFARAVRTEFGPDVPLHVYRMRTHTIVYYLDEPVQRIEDPEVLRQRIAETRGLTVVTWHASAAELPNWADVRVLKTFQRPDQRPDESLLVLRLTPRPEAVEPVPNVPPNLAMRVATGQ